MLAHTAQAETRTDEDGRRGILRPTGEEIHYVNTTREGGGPGTHCTSRHSNRIGGFLYRNPTPFPYKTNHTSDINSLGPIIEITLRTHLP